MAGEAPIHPTGNHANHDEVAGADGVDSRPYPIRDLATIDKLMPEVIARRSCRVSDRCGTFVVAARAKHTYVMPVPRRTAQRFVRVALVLPTEYAYARNVMRGIVAATRARNM